MSAVQERKDSDDITLWHGYDSEANWLAACESARDSVLAELYTQYWKHHELRPVSEDAPDVIRHYNGELRVVIPKRKRGSIMDICFDSNRLAGSEYLKRLRCDFVEHGIYMMDAKQRGFDVVGVLYDIVSIPDMRPFRPTPEKARKYKPDGTLYANQSDCYESPAEFKRRVNCAILIDPSSRFMRVVAGKVGDGDEHWI